MLIFFDVYVYVYVYVYSYVNKLIKNQKQSKKK